MIGEELTLPIKATEQSRLIYQIRPHLVTFFPAPYIPELLPKISRHLVYKEYERNNVMEILGNTRTSINIFRMAIISIFLDELDTEFLSKAFGIDESQVRRLTRRVRQLKKR